MERLGRALGVSPIHILPAEMTEMPFDPEEETGFHWADMHGVYVTPWPVPVSRQQAGYSPHGCAWFGLEFLARMNIDPVLCKVVEIRDSSMHVSLPNGSVALVDGARLELVDQGLLRHRVRFRPAHPLLPKETSRGKWRFEAETDDWPPVFSTTT